MIDRNGVVRRLLPVAAASLLFLVGQPSPAAPPAQAAGRHLVVATAGQEARFAPAFATVDSWVAKGAFPGAVLAVGQHGRLVALKAFGRIASSAGAPPMPVDALFDLASLTKVIGTTTAAEILYDRHQLDLDAPVVRYLPEFGAVPGHDRITVRDLLTHSSGLQSADMSWQYAKDRQGILQRLYAMPATDPPGTVFAYRDTNLILRSMRNTARVFKNAVSDEVVALEKRPGGAGFEEVRPLVAGQRGRAALQSGDVQDGIVSAGMVIGLIDDIPTCDDLIRRMVADCRAHLRRALALAEE